MSEAKQCDRCGKLYELKFLDEVDYRADWWRFILSKDMHPYGEVKIDLCNECRKNLAEWYKNGGTE